MSKINIDAGCMSNGTTCWGMILRNHVGAVIYAATKKENVQVSPLLTEALGMRWTLLWLNENNYENVVMETNDEQVVKCPKNQYLCLSFLGKRI
jgi:hypothetical protein